MSIKAGNFPWKYESPEDQLASIIRASASSRHHTSGINPQASLGKIFLFLFEPDPVAASLAFTSTMGVYGGGGGGASFNHLLCGNTIRRTRQLGPGTDTHPWGRQPVLITILTPTDQSAKTSENSVVYQEGIYSTGIHHLSDEVDFTELFMTHEKMYIITKTQDTITRTIIQFIPQFSFTRQRNIQSKFNKSSSILFIFYLHHVLKIFSEFLRHFGCGEEVSRLSLWPAVNIRKRELVRVATLTSYRCARRQNMSTVKPNLGKATHLQTPTNIREVKNTHCRSYSCCVGCGCSTASAAGFSLCFTWSVLWWASVRSCWAHRPARLMTSV